ncbi:glycosyltransferase [Flavobacterium praedii]|uniref:glycosyltransferase n=1 Tax=Flavobacterium praedii TaxID=3002900 RepID=UPI002481F1BC|nr:glycosyltransferase [Flavobacterium praedii]
MKVIQISTGFDISFNGGITNYVRNISESLIDAGHEVTVIYSNDNGIKKEYVFNTISIDTKMQAFGLTSVVSNGDIAKLEKIIKREKPDIIHVHMMIDLPIKVLEMFKKHAKLVISLHDYYYICNRIVLMKADGSNCVDSNENKDCNSCIQRNEAIGNRYWRFINKKIKNIFYKDSFSPSSGHHERFVVGNKMFKEADLLIAVSNRVREIYQNNGFVNDKFVVNHIGNYTAEEDFRSLFGGRKFKETNDIIRFGFMGNLNYHKGANILLELIKNTKHEFHIYGRVAPNVLEEIKTNEKVIYHGEYKHTDLPSILKDIDFGLVLPVWEDNAPQVIFEFLNAGIPIIGTKKGGLPDFINDKNGKLFGVNENDIVEMKKYINSTELIGFYNKVINNIEGTKKANQHSRELIELYNDL